MALSNLDKNTITRLFEMLNLNNKKWMTSYISSYFPSSMTTSSASSYCGCSVSSIE